MGRRLNALLRRNFKTSKFKTLVKLSLSRIAILKNHHQSRLSHARSDVRELLLLGQQDRALLRVEHVIKEQNTLDVYALVDFYCHVLLERVKLFKQKNGECPDELKEPTSSLIFAASRRGEFPELQKIRGIFTSQFGKEFCARAVELRNNCGVNPMMVQKLSTRQTSLESRLKVLKEIASENGITLHLEEDAPVEAKEKVDMNHKQEQEGSTTYATSVNSELRYDTYALPEEIEQDDKFSESMKGRKKYRDVASAAQEAFESAAYAAAAARAAVELSISRSTHKDYDDHDSSDNQGALSDFDVSSSTELHISKATEHLYDSEGSDKIHLVINPSISLESEGGDMASNEYDVHLREVTEKKKKQGKEIKTSTSDLNIENDYIPRLSALKLCKKDPQDDIASEGNYEDKNIKIWLKHHDLSTDGKPSLPMNEGRHKNQ
ncbi:hypothetical protein UlMin_014399 [Ulmus minor]